MRYFSLLLVFCCFVAVSCREEPPSPAPERVVLMYMGADNDLAPETTDQIEALRQGWDVLRKGHLYIYVDRAGEAPSLLKMVREGDETIVKTVLEYKESNAADADVLASVITDVRMLHPDPEVQWGLLLFSHASGWLPAGVLKKPELRTLVMDKTNEMGMAAFAGALPDGMFNFIVFDACYTCGIELLYALRDKTNFIVGSSAEILSPGYTPYYAEVLRYLFQNRLNLVGFAQTVFNHINERNGNERSATFSVVSTAELESLHAFVHEHCDLSKTVTLSPLQDFGRYQYRSLFFDFEQYYSQLLDDSTKVEMLAELLDKCVLYKAATETFLPDDDGFAITHHSGITTYIPQSWHPRLTELWYQTAWGKGDN